MSSKKGQRNKSSKKASEIASVKISNKPNNWRTIPSEQEINWFLNKNYKKHTKKSSPRCPYWEKAVQSCGVSYCRVSKPQIK
jgi:hypothetical protein